MQNFAGRAYCGSCSHFSAKDIILVKNFASDENDMTIELHHAENLYLKDPGTDSDYSLPVVKLWA